MSPRRFSIPHPIVVALAVASGMGLASPFGCKPPTPPASAPARAIDWTVDDQALAAPSREFLSARLALVTAGNLTEAHARWVERVLLPLESTPDTREGVASQQLKSAIRAYEHTNRSGVATERLAQACDRSGWFRDAAFVLERGPGLGSLTPAAEELAGVLGNIARLAAALDSLVATRIGPGFELATPPPPIGSAAATITRRLGITPEALRAHGLMLSIRPSPDPERPDQVELAVIAQTDGPLTLAQDGATFELRRVILDDNAILEPTRAQPWDSATLWEVENGAVLVYHRRDHLRTTAVGLFHRLESAGGTAPLPGAGAPDSAVAGALRLASVLPLFDRARSETAPRREILRRFVLDYLSARMAQGEAAAGRQLLDVRRGEEPPAGEEQAARQLLAALRFAPLPRLALADAIDRAAREAGDEAGGARNVIRALAARAAGPGGESPASTLAAIGEERLRELASAVDRGPALNP